MVKEINLQAGDKGNGGCVCVGNRFFGAALELGCLGGNERFREKVCNLFETPLLKGLEVFLDLKKI